jgi:hypothetical protein
MDFFGALNFKGGGVRSRLGGIESELAEREAHGPRTDHFEECSSGIGHNSSPLEMSKEG